MLSSYSYINAEFSQSIKKVGETFFFQDDIFNWSGKFKNLTKVSVFWSQKFKAEESSHEKRGIIAKKDLDG